MDVTGKQSNSLSGEYKKEVPMRELLLGVDIGTSACKVAVFNKQGEVIASGNGAYQVYTHIRDGQNRTRMSGGVRYAAQSEMS